MLRASTKSNYKTTNRSTCAHQFRIIMLLLFSHNPFSERGNQETRFTIITQDRCNILKRSRVRVHVTIYCSRIYCLLLIKNNIILSYGIRLLINHNISVCELNAYAFTFHYIVYNHSNHDVSFVQYFDTILFIPKLISLYYFNLRYIVC